MLCPTRTVPGSNRGRPGIPDVTTVTSCPRLLRPFAVASTCSVTPPRVGRYAWETIPILSRIGRAPERTEDAPLCHVLRDGALLRPGDERGEAREILAKREARVGLIETVEDDFMTPVLAPGRMRVEDRRPRPARENGRAGGKGNAPSEEGSGQRSRVDVPVHEQHHDGSAPEGLDERREALARRSNDHSLARLPVAQRAGEERMDLHPAHRVHLEPESCQGEPGPLPASQVRCRDHGAPPWGERAIQELGSPKPRGASPAAYARPREVLDPGQRQALEHAARGALACPRARERRMSGG